MRIALPPTISPAAFAGHDPAAAVIDLAGETMGTIWRVRYAHAGSGDPRAAIEARLAGIVREMSQWSEGSLLSRFNRSAAGTWTLLPADFARVMSRGLEIAAATAGAFDPAIGRLVDLSGFGPVAVEAAPEVAAIADAQAVSGWRRLRLIPAHRSVALPRRTPGPSGVAQENGVQRQPTAVPQLDPGVRRGSAGSGAYLYQRGGLALDLSGIAKGYAVDAIAELLRAHGIAHCLVEIGGELVGRGIRPDGEPWWVDLESPPGLDLPPLRIALHGIAVATSGDYRRGAHTLDPRTGRPITNGMISASVIHETALEADAWATALTVLGADEALALATERGIAARLVTVIDGVAREHLTPALDAMLAD